MVSDFIQGIRSILYWLPVIWRDRDWDYAFSLWVFQHSLKRLRACIDRNRRHVGDEKRVKEMTVAILLLDRLLDGDYSVRCRPLPEPRYLWEGSTHTITWNVDDWHYLEDQDWNYLFAHLCKHMRGWWD